MPGVELVTGGWFASAVIGKVVDLGRSYLGDNYNLHTGTREMLKNLVENQLPHIQSVIQAADERKITNKGLTKWLEQLNDVAYEAEDVLDDFEAKRIHDSIKGKAKVIEIASSSVKLVKTLIFSDKDLNKLKSVVNKIDKLCNKDSFKISQIIDCGKRKEHFDSLDSETSSELATGVAIFGRDTEIEFILDIMFNVLYGDFYHKDIDDPNSQQGKGKGSSRFWDLLSGLSIPWLPKIIQIVIKGDAPDDVPEPSSYTHVSKKFKNSDAPEPSGCTKIFHRMRDAPKQRTTMTVPHYISNDKLAVIPIVGVGGVGKTVVAKMIYNNERVKEHFALRAWVYVSENCDAKKIMQEILCSFEGGIIDPLMNLENVGNKLKETLKNRRFLLVFDDLRDRTELKWSELRSVLCYGEIGSVVVVTTQSINIANTIGTLPKVTLDVLQPESFWELFQYYAFGGFKLGYLNDQPPLSPSKQEDLKKIGKQIADKLHGLPLAGEFIGTLLSKRLERQFWEDICVSDWWNIEGAHENILPSIGVGYNYLDPDLKQCFVFCSIFPKHHVFERERLIQLWIAHGFIQPSEEEIDRLEKEEIRLEDIGRKRFNKLVDRSFFQPTVSDGKYVMHDLVLDLAKAVSSNEFCFVKIPNNHLPSLARHVGIDCDNSKVEWKCKDSTRLRTMILFGNWYYCNGKSISNIFAKYNGLRVLDLSYISFKTREPINATCQLSHLRILDLSFTDINSIPNKFCGLCHLEVLDVRGCNFEKLPEGMNQLINLRHLYASSDTISLISGIGKLTKLQELDELCIGESKGHRISELMDMNEISGHLLLSNLDNVSSKEEAAKSQLDKKRYLKSLELRFQYNDRRPRTEVKIEVLNALKPACSLEILKVGGCRWKSFPDWVFSPHHGFYNLKAIHVYCFWLSSLPAFGELRSLEIVSFDDLPLIEKVGSEFYGSSNVVFPSLKELKFSKMLSWRHWSGAEIGKTIFPHLKKLHLQKCSSLKELPTGSFSSSVVELKLLECPDLCNIGTVLQGMPSIAHLSITKVCNKCLFIDCTPLSSLEVMHLSGIEQLRFVGGLKSLVNLRKLVIKEFYEILDSYEVEQDNNEISQEDNEEQCLQFLIYLELRHSIYSTQRILPIGRLSSLRELVIENSPVVEYTRDEESWFNQLTSLEKLEFCNCRRLQFLPSQLHLLTSLKKLHINKCHNLISLPVNGLPQNLAELYIRRCPYLMLRCQPNKGDDWHKLDFIPFYTKIRRPDETRLCPLLCKCWEDLEKQKKIETRNLYSPDLKKWYSHLYADYFVVEKPLFFVGLIWVEILFLCVWPTCMAFLKTGANLRSSLSWPEFVLALPWLL